MVCFPGRNGVRSSEYSKRVGSAGPVRTFDRSLSGLAWLC